MEMGYVPGGQDRYGQTILVPGIVASRYQERDVPPPPCACGRAARRTCVVCGETMCDDHGTPIVDQFACAAHVPEVRRSVEAYERQAAQDRAEFERLTPRFPYPPSIPAKSLTYGDRMSTRYSHLRSTDAETQAPLSEIVAALHALLPRGQRKVRVEPKTWLLYLGKHATGWPFTHRFSTKSSNELQHDTSATHDVLWRWLIQPGQGYWEIKGRGVLKGEADPPETDFARAHHYFGASTIHWDSAMLIRQDLLRKLGHSAV